MASAARSIALGLVLGGISSNTGAYAAGPRLRTPSFIKTVDERASKACGLRITLASQPAGIGRDCGGAGCEALPRASRFKDATVGIVGGPTHHIGDASSWREIFDVDCVDGGRILHVTFDPVEGHSLVCELGPAENISSVRDKVCSGPDGAHFYYTVEHGEIFPPKYMGVNPQLAPRLLQSVDDSTMSSSSSTTTSTDNAPAAQPTSSPTTKADLTLSPKTPTPAPSSAATPEATTVEPIAEPTTAESTAEPTTVEPTAESTTVEPIAEPTTVEPTAEPTTVEPTAEPTTIEPTALPTTVEPTAEPTPNQTPVSGTEAATPAPSNVENTPTPTLLPSPEPSTPEPSRIIVPTSQPTVPTPQPATPEATPTPSGTTFVGEPTASPAVDETPQPTAMPVVPPTPQPTAIVAPVSSPTATTVKPVTAPPTSLPPSLEPTTSPSGTTSAPASTPTVTPSTETPVGSPQAGPTVKPTVAVTPLPTDLGPTPAPFTTPAPSSEGKCSNECSDIDTGNTWTGNYNDTICSTDATEGGCGLTDVDVNCRRCVINRANFADESSSNTEADEWPNCPCCVAADTDGVEESDIEACGIVTPSPTSLLETMILSDDELDLMMLTGAFDGDSCLANGIAIIDDRVMAITKFSDSNGNCTDSFDMLYGTIECTSDTNYNWTYSSDEYTYSYECPDPDTTSSVRFRRRRLSESEETVTISSENVLCNDGEVFYSVSRADEDESVAIVYANTKADGFEDAIGDVESSASGGDYCDDVSAASTAALVAGVDTLIDDAGGDTGSDTDTTLIAIIVSVVALVVLLSLCACYCCYRSRKGKEGRADQMRRNLGFTPDMDRKGEGNFGPTNKHVAITRGGGAQMTSEMLATKTFQPGTGQHHRAPSEAPSSIIEDNIANNYRPKKAAQNWEKRKEHKSTKPAPQQHVIGAGPTSEELKVEDMPATSVRSEQLSEHSLTQHDISSARQSVSHPSVAQTQYSYAFNDVEIDPAEEEEEDDDDARSAATGMSGPSKYAPSGYAPSSHHEGVTHDLMSQYEPSVYEADSQYDPSLYGRESEFGEESSAYSYGPSSRNGAYGQGGNYAGRGRQALPHGPSARASVADTAAMSHLGSVMEMDDGGETNSAYAPSDSYVSSYVSSEDDEIGRGRPTRGHHHLADSRTPPGGYGTRHNVYRSGREAVNAGRGGFGGGGGSSIEASSRHSGGRSGFEVDSRDYDEEDSDMHHMSAAMDDMEYQDSRITTSSQGAPLTGVDDRNGRRW